MLVISGQGQSEKKKLVCENYTTTWFARNFYDLSVLMKNIFKAEKLRTIHTVLDIRHSWNKACDEHGICREPLKSDVRKIHISYLFVLSLLLTDIKLWVTIYERSKIKMTYIEGMDIEDWLYYETIMSFFSCQRCSCFWHLVADETSFFSILFQNGKIRLGKFSQKMEIICCHRNP